MNTNPDTRRIMSAASTPAITVKYSVSVTKGRTHTHMVMLANITVAQMEADYQKEADQLQLLCTY